MVIVRGGGGVYPTGRELRVNKDRKFLLLTCACSLPWPPMVVNACVPHRIVLKVVLKIVIFIDLPGIVRAGEVTILNFTAHTLEYLVVFGYI